ncbi:MAG: hypothetical protein ISR57_05920 [Bacteroidales bacterium]|nr:hypothetical protein [Bacteroidales bacterium]
MYITSIIWYLSWPAMIAVSTIIIYYTVRKFDNKQNKTSKCNPYEKSDFH